MNTKRVFLTSGIWVAILPYLGFPENIKVILFTITGLILVYLSLLASKEPLREFKEKYNFDNFAENERNK